MDSMQGESWNMGHSPQPAQRASRARQWLKVAEQLYSLSKRSGTPDSFGLREKDAKKEHVRCVPIPTTLLFTIC